MSIDVICKRQDISLIERNIIMFKKHSFCAIIVNYFGCEDTTRCVNSLIASAGKSNTTLSILVVNNSDESLHFDNESVTILRTGHNIGLSGAWYIGFYNEVAQNSDYVVFLNNDAVVALDFFGLMDSGINLWGSDCAFGPRILHDSNQKIIWSRGGKINRFSVKIEHFSENKPVNEVKTADFQTGHLSGCCMVINVDHLNEIGGPDTNFFFRGEEWDLNYRLKEHGVRLVILDSAEVFHKVNGSHDRFSPLMLYFAYRAKVLFAKKILPEFYFPFWFACALIYSTIISPSRFSRLSGRDASNIRRALIAALIVGRRNNKILPPKGDFYK